MRWIKVFLFLYYELRTASYLYPIALNIAILIRPIYAYQYAFPVSLSAAIHFCVYVLFHPLRVTAPLCIWQPFMATQKWSPVYWPEGPTLRPLIRWGGRWGSGKNDALLNFTCSLNECVECCLFVSSMSSMRWELYCAFVHNRNRHIPYHRH